MAFDLLEEKQNQAIVLSAIQAGLVKVPMTVQKAD